MRWPHPALISLLAMLACGSPASVPSPTTPRAEPIDAGVDDATRGTRVGEGATAAPRAEEAIKIATFNIQVFGPTKAGKPEIMSQLAAIIRGYDVIAIQEIKDSTGAAPQALLDAVNDDGDRTYAMLLSPRTGLQTDDAASQEQYAVLYDTALIEPLPGDRLFDDEGHDLFQREPYLAQLRTRVGGFSFVLVSIHTRPDSAVSEIAALHEVVEWGRAVFASEDDFIALGDFNAGCRYASSAELDALQLRGPSYLWIVPDESDSNVSPNSACAYDRIVTTAGSEAQFTGNWGVDRAFTDSAVSDHWPVWAEFRAAE